MTEYLLFCGDLIQEARGGAHDLVGTYGTVADALYACSEHLSNMPVTCWAEILELNKGEHNVILELRDDDLNIKPRGVKWIFTPIAPDLGWREKK